MPATEQTRAPRGGRREQLLKAAAELFAERGYATTSIDAIGAHAGVTGPAVYRHFGGKRDLLLTLLSGAVESTLADMTKAMDQGAPPAENLELLVRQVVQHAIAERQVVSLLYGQTGALAANDRKRVEALRDQIVATWTNALRSARPELSPGDAMTYVRGALSVIGGVALREPGPNGDVIYTRMIMGLLTA